MAHASAAPQNETRKTFHIGVFFVSFSDGRTGAGAGAPGPGDGEETGAPEGIWSFMAISNRVYETIRAEKARGSL